MGDFKFAFRQLSKNPGFVAVAVLTLALGIGANTAIFSVLNTLMLRPLPYENPDRLIRVFRTSPQVQSWPHSVANFLDEREQNNVFENLAALKRTRFSLAEIGQPAISIRGAATTFELFPALKCPAVLGRLFTREDEQTGRHQVVVLSHSFWVRHFGANTNILGRTLRMDGESVNVIGVLSASFEYLPLWGPIEAFRPLAFTPEQRQDRRDAWLDVIGRLKDGITLDQANLAMKSLAVRLAELSPDYNANQSLRVAPLHQSIGDEASRRFAWLMLGLTGFVLLIACANLANLQLARAATRSRELAVRLALGTSRGRLMRQLLIESLMIAMIGGICGVILANWISTYVGTRLTRWSPDGIAITPDLQVLLFALFCALATGVLFGLAPAWLVSRTNMNDVLKATNRASTAGGSQNRLRYSLIVGEFAFALVLLTGAGLFISGLKEFIHQDPGWRIDGLLLGWLPQSGSKYATSEQRRAFVERLEERLLRLPGVEQVAISSSSPIWSFGTTRPFLIEGRQPPPAGQEPLLFAESVNAGYFDALRIKLREGRLLSAMDTFNRPSVAVINAQMARHFWPGESPIGKRIAGADRNNPEWLEIVGVVNDVRFPANLGRPETVWQMYRPLAQEPRPAVVVQLRTAGPPGTVAELLRQAVAELDSDLPVNELEPARQMVDRMLGHFTLAGTFLGWFAALGLILAALGIYGVVSYLVVQRTGEIGIRLALGAQRFDIVWLVLGKGFVLSGLGIVVGLAGAFGIARLLAAAVPEIPANNPLGFIGVTAALFAVGLLACWLPARRATRIEAITALRCE